MIPLRTQYPNRLSYNPYSTSRARAAGMQDVNFGVDMQIPGIPPAPVAQRPIEPKNQFNMNPTPEPQPQVPGINQQPIDFAAEYAKLNSNRPNRLAYQQTVEQGEPTIKRSNWAKLAALIAGAGAGASEGATAGMNLGLSSYYEPQRRASERFKEKQKGLRDMATMEDSDIANQIKALEAKQADLYRSREDARQQAESERQAKESTLRMKSAQDEMDRRDLYIYTDAEGQTWRKNLKTGEVTPVAKTGLSQKEKIDLAGQEEEAREKARLPGEREKMRSQEKIAGMQVTGRQNVADTNRQAKLDVTNAKLNSLGKILKPKEKAAAVWTDIQKYFNETDGLEGLDPEDYLAVTIGPDGNHIITTKPSKRPTWGGLGEEVDDEKTAKIKAALRKVIADSLAKNSTAAGRGGGPGGGPPLPPGWSR